MVATTFQKRVPHLPHQQQAQTHRQQIKDMLPNRVVGYSPDLARIVGGATTGLFLSQLLFLSDKGNNPEGWVYKSEAEMGKETGLTKREQQTARRKLLSLGVIAIMRGGWKNTYHFKVIWEKLYQVIAGSQPVQNVSTEKPKPPQNVTAQSEHNVSTEPPQCQQNVPKEHWQNVATPDTHRENNREIKETEKTSRENQTIWDRVLEQVKTDLAIGAIPARLAGTALLEVTDAAARIGVDNPFALAWLERRMYGQIASAIKQILGKDLDLQFIPSEVGVSPAGFLGV
jgi:hypothetical protein